MSKSRHVELAPELKASRQRYWDTLGISIGASILIGVVAVYLIAATRGWFPSGHPLSSLMWCFIAYMTVRPAVNGTRLPRWIYYVTAVMAAIGMSLWLWATLENQMTPPLVPGLNR